MTISHIKYIGEIYVERNERSKPEQELLSVAQNNGVVPRCEIEAVQPDALCLL